MNVENTATRIMNEIVPLFLRQWLHDFNPDFMLATAVEMQRPSCCLARSKPASFQELLKDLLKSAGIEVDEYLTPLGSHCSGHDYSFRKATERSPGYFKTAS